MVKPMNSDDNTSLKITKNDSVPSFHGEDILTEVIVMSTKDSMTNISLSSSKENHKAIDAQKHRGGLDRRPACTIELTMADMSRRLNIRKRLHDRLYDNYLKFPLINFFLLGLL
jgi:hypothetical protein